MLQYNVAIHSFLVGDYPNAIRRLKRALDELRDERYRAGASLCLDRGNDGNVVAVELRDRPLLVNAIKKSLEILEAMP